MLEDNLILLIEGLKKKNHIKILLETNGTIFGMRIFSRCDFISMDIKPPSSGHSGYNKEALQYCLRNPKKSQVKVVIQDDNDLKFFKNIINKKKNKGYPNWVLQPEWSERGGLDYAKIIKMFGNNIRVVPQIHRILDIR